MERIQGIETIVQGIKRPGQLPGAKVLLPALLVKVGKQQEEQQGHDPWHHHHADGEAIHIPGNSSPCSLLFHIGTLVPSFHTILDKTIFLDGSWGVRVILVTKTRLLKFEFL